MLLHDGLDNFGSKGIGGGRTGDDGNVLDRREGIPHGRGNRFHKFSYKLDIRFIHRERGP